MVMTSISPLLVEITAVYKLSLSQSGFIFSANFIGFVIFIFIGGIVSDLLSKKTVLAVALVGFSFSLLIIQVIPNYMVLCLLMALIGGFGGILESLVSSLVYEMNPYNTSFCVNMTQVFFGIGALVGPILTSYALSKGVEWSACYTTAGIASAIVALLFMFVKIQDVKATENKIFFVKLKKLLIDKKFLLICVCIAFYTGAEIGCWGWMSTFVKDRLNFSLLESGVAVGVFWITMTLGRLLCGQFTFKYKPSNIIIALALSSSIITLVSGISTAKPVAWVVIIFLGLTYSSQWPLIVSYGGDYCGTSSGIIFSILVGSGGIGTTVVPYFMGVIGQITNVTFAMASPAVLLLFVGLIFIYMEKSSSKKAFNY